MVHSFMHSGWLPGVPAGASSSPEHRLPRPKHTHTASVGLACQPCVQRNCMPAHVTKACSQLLRVRVPLYNIIQCASLQRGETACALQMHLSKWRVNSSTGIHRPYAPITRPSEAHSANFRACSGLLRSIHSTRSTDAGFRHDTSTTAADAPAHIATKHRNCSMTTKPLQNASFSGWI